MPTVNYNLNEIPSTFIYVEAGVTQKKAWLDAARTSPKNVLLFYLTSVSEAYQVAEVRWILWLSKIDSVAAVMNR